MISKKESKILQVLRKNSKTSLVEISTLTSIPKSTVFDKIVRLHRRGLIKFVCLLCFEKLGFNRRYLFLMNADNKKQKIAQYLSNCSLVNNLHTGIEFDFIFETVSKSENEIKAFLSYLMQNFPVNFIQKIRLNKEICRENFWRNRK
ncbi:winged helix-turn-helix transcriptional regulator [Candidatus Woesearchaeota archaeon]|nr:winged helix-turn-helix transcriptional regulator [Candidatus Woesearchaeota archaeon]